MEHKSWNDEIVGSHCRWQLLEHSYSQSRLPHKKSSDAVAAPIRLDLATLPLAVVSPATAGSPVVESGTVDTATALDFFKKSNLITSI